ncbi:MAG TPA: RNA methyltransferase [Oligoflexia bacterium]|nr:RNA methyltransferase [Oligoflexia bacterium]HMR24182.1 RNA methyltransferase [Oligoflexia bacterium]
MTDERLDKIKQLATQRQTDLAVLLENVHDPHNIGAVLRTCDAAGIFNVYILNTDYRLPKTIEAFNEKASSGARKWVKIHFYTDLKQCFDAIKQNYTKLYASNLNNESLEVYNIDFSSEPSILMFGNEHEGLTAKALKQSTHHFHIPQVGMVQSLNISVACAISVYEAVRQKKIKGHYSNNTQEHIDAIESYYLKQHYRKK